MKISQSARKEKSAALQKISLFNGGKTWKIIAPLCSDDDSTSIPLKLSWIVKYICMEWSEHNGSYAPPVCINTLVFGKKASSYFFFLNMLTKPITSWIWSFATSHFSSVLFQEPLIKVISNISFFCFPFFSCSAANFVSSDILVFKSVLCLIAS